MLILPLSFSEMQKDKKTRTNEVCRGRNERKGADTVDYLVENVVLPCSRRNAVLLKPTVIILCLSVSLVMGFLSIQDFYLSGNMYQERSVSPAGTPPIAFITPSLSCYLAHIVPTTQRHHFHTYHFSPFKVETVSRTYFFIHDRTWWTDHLLFLPSINLPAPRCPHACQTDAPSFDKAIVGSDSFYPVFLFVCGLSHCVPVSLSYFALSPPVLFPFLLFVHYIGR